MKYRSFPVLAGALALASVGFCAENAPIGAVNFASCITESKYGKKEQENMENIRKQMSSMIENTDKELKELSAKFEDTEFLDSLSPKAEEEMKVRYQALQEDLGRLQNQFYQILQHTQYQMVQKISGNIAKAAQAVAQETGIPYILNREACFYIDPNLDVTDKVISLMDAAYEAEETKNKLSENTTAIASPEGNQAPALDAQAK
jgi:outer membrane protein